MRIRTILAAAAAPAALAAVLLGTAGQASAAVTQGPAAAVLAASVKTQTYQANTHQHRLADTTSVDTNLAGNATINNDGRQYGNIGPVWAFDNMERQLSATDNGVVTDPASPGLHEYSVRIASVGSYDAFASPITGLVMTGHGPVSGWVDFTVYSATPPSGVNLPAQLDTQDHSSAIVQKWFGSAAQVTGGNHYHFEYKGIQGATDGPGGLYVQNGN